MPVQVGSVAGHQIVADSAVQRVVATASDERVVAILAVEVVGAVVLPRQPVSVGIALQKIA
ncbi:MAG: hypothetical protein Q8K50_07680, partial [Hydrogenophaga sp.]|nr:hypothetical protein [Hydrogenophaga sp.]